MYDFTSYHSYSDFAARVKTQERYSQGAEVRKFLLAVTATSRTRLKSLPDGTILWRAQLGCEWATADESDGGYDFPMPHSPKRMIPLRSAPSEGRVNPVGIPVLYLATTESTAISEVRAWVGKSVSVAQFKVMRKLRILDCASDKLSDPTDIDEPPDPKTTEQMVWASINKAFSEPASNEDDRTTYISTQMLAEHFKSLGADGVAYNSSLGDGKNFALFDIDAAEIINCALHSINSVKFEYDEMTNPYYVSKHYPITRGDA